MRIKENRTASFIALFIVYVLAAVAGVAVYRALSYEWWINLFIADFAATVLTFIFSLIFKNASVYDPYWSVQPPFILTAFALGTRLNAARILLLAAVWFWGIRLTANWAYTFKGLTHQDWRYTMLDEKTGKLYPFVNFTGIHLVPTIVVYLCILPAVYAFKYDVKLNIIAVVFTAVSICAASMQGIADIQMQRFRKSKTGGFIRVGLWKNSRHPNYLGEIMMWWGIGIASFSMMPSRWSLLIGAAANTVLFLVVSIPMADNRQAKKPGFKEYKAETRKLLPIPVFR